jgi:hypothetical protein
MSWGRCAWCWGWRALRHDRNSDRASEIKEAAILVFASSSAPIKPATEGKVQGGLDGPPRFRDQSKSNMSNRSPTAGIFTGTYGWLGSMCGLGRLSRLRAERRLRSQLRSMNLTNDA